MVSLEISQKKKIKLILEFIKQNSFYELISVENKIKISIEKYIQYIINLENKYFNLKNGKQYSIKIVTNEEEIKSQKIILLLLANIIRYNIILFNKFI